MVGGPKTDSYLSVPYGQGPPRWFANGRARPLGTALWVILTCSVAAIGLFDCNQKRTAPAIDGALVFQQKCAVCHVANGASRAPLLPSLRQMSRTSILATLQTGEMKSQGAGLTRAERLAVAQYLGDPRTSGMLTGFCPVNIDPPADGPVWNAWGVDLGNTRFQDGQSARISRSEVPGLKLKWAFGFAGASASYGQPTVFAGRLFVGSEDGTVYSIDARSGCIWWTFQASGTVKTAISVGNGGAVAFFGDTTGSVYAVRVSNGSLLWMTHPEDHPAARITGSPVLDGARLYVPVSSGEEGAAADPKYECCTFRGSLVALDAGSGKLLWKSYTIRDPPKPLGKSAAGVRKWGPSGAAIWSSPTVDARRHTIYVATGNNYSEPASATSDAVIALNIDSGKMLWSRQLTAHDLWNIACVADTKSNCPDKTGDDFDFGAPPMLRTLSGGRDILLAAQKSGIVYALDPNRAGRVIWQRRIGQGGPLGGIEWGGATDRRHAYFPLSDWRDSNPAAGGGLFALNLSTGRRAWYAPPPKPDCADLIGCSAAQMAPPTAIPGVVFSGSLDGHLRAYDAHSGAVIWDFNTARDFKTINGVKAHGGSLNNGGPAVADGMLYVNAGYTNELNGNILLAFSPNGR
jgi:polyvinyl alcohol dehydrogenase (cytochrome)